MCSWRRVSEQSHLPNRRFPLEELGVISPLKPKTVEEKNETVDNVGVENVENDGFVLPKKGNRRAIYIPKDEIFANIRNFLDGINNDRRQRI